MTEHESSGGLLNNQLMMWAIEHSKNSDGRFVTLDYQPDTYPGQKGVSVDGTPLPQHVIDSYATEIQPNYTAFLNTLEHQESKLEVVGELLRGGNNVILATNHGEITDIALAHAALYSKLIRLGYKGEKPVNRKDNRDFKTALIASKMIAFLGIATEDSPLPTVTVLNMLESKLLLSYPRTDSSRTRGIGVKDNVEVRIHNKQLKIITDRLLGRGAVLLAVAPSGTVDKPAPYDPNKLILSNLSKGTKDMFRGKNTYVLGAAVSLDDRDPFIEFVGNPKVIRTYKEAEGVMHDIANTLTDRHPSKQYAYQIS